MTTRAELDRQALYAAILADPSDDVPRLVYADFLEENGERERGEFIRVQVELAKCYGCGGTGRRRVKCQTNGREEWTEFDCNLGAKIERGKGWVGGCPANRRRERELLDAHEGDWAPQELGPFAAHSGSVFTFRRGFVDAVECPASAWLEHGPRLVREHPLSTVRLSGVEPGMRRGRYEWMLGDDEPPVFASELPKELYVPDTFASESEAQDALSARCLSWARAASRDGTDRGRAPSAGSSS